MTKMTRLDGYPPLAFNPIIALPNPEAYFSISQKLADFITEIQPAGLIRSIHISGNSTFSALHFAQANGASFEMK